MEDFIELLFALAPSLGISLFVYYKDRHDPEPKRLLLFCFLLGALSIVPAMLGTYGIKYALNLDHTDDAPDMDQLIYAFIAVALSEEGAKFLFLRWYAYPKKAFDEPFDGIIYSVMISMGFATLENILYVFDDGGGISAAIYRTFTAVPGHASFAVIMGYYVGMSKFSHRRYLQFVGLAAAVFLHGVYDACLFLRHHPIMVIGAILTVLISVVYSLKAIRLHQEISPFKKIPSQDEKSDESNKDLT